MRFCLPIVVLVSIAMVPRNLAASDTAPVEKTGQSTCFSTSTEIPCAGTGQDGEIQAGVVVPTPRFTDLGNGAVRDNLTGLKWLRDGLCTDLPGTDDSGMADWLAALAAANNLEDGICGLSDGSAKGDWRLPNLKELQSLVHLGFHSPALSNTQGDSQWTTGDPFFNADFFVGHWTSTTDPRSHGYAFTVGVMATGYPWSDYKTHENHVWPVSGPDGNGGAPPVAPVEKTGQDACFSLSNEVPCGTTGQDGEIQSGVDFPSPRFSDLGNGVVRDNMTGLEWLQDTYCQDLAGTTNGSTDWWGAFAAAAGLAHGDCGLTDGSLQGDWRLPNVNELLSLAHFGFSAPALSNAAGNAQWTQGDPFLNVDSWYNAFWSSTTNPGELSDGFAVDIGDNGAVISDYKTASNRVWAVKGQSVELPLFADGFESGDTSGWSTTVE